MKWFNLIISTLSILGYTYIARAANEVRFGIQVFLVLVKNKEMNKTKKNPWYVGEQVLQHIFTLATLQVGLEKEDAKIIVIKYILGKGERNESYLSIKNIGLRVSFDKVVSSPLNSIHGIAQFTTWTQLLPIFNYAPWHHGNCECHWQAEFHIVPCIVVPSYQIHLQLEKYNLNHQTHYIFCGDKETPTGQCKRKKPIRMSSLPR